MDHAAADGRDDAPLILIVDDERDIADMLDSYFRLEGYRTIVAHDAAGALTAAHRPLRGAHVAHVGERGARARGRRRRAGLRRRRPRARHRALLGEVKGRGGHLGLGLYVSRLLAEKHGGGLEVANGPGGGAIARATLSAPMAQGSPESN